ncbi:MAG: hypothetical protein O3A87_08800 [Verrucomicrobia bacterium]|nr:hypothetical protein [Verrucomicrobiota bacterium]MDA1006560.1 hypothetical protein [Verrucomicrobiota bacterium]
MVLVGCAWFGAGVRGEKEVVVEGPLFREAAQQFESMTTTLYQHGTRVDREAGSYKYDCVGMVSYALREAAPVAWATVFRETGLAKGRIPSPPKYQVFFAGLAGEPKAGWEAVEKVSDLRPGDVVSWEHKTANSSGHAVIIAGLPKRQEDGEWLVKVFDATSSPHGEGDSRRKDQRAQILERTGKPSGLGHGMMVFVADAKSGALSGLRWSPGGKLRILPIGAGRPTR